MVGITTGHEAALKRQAVQFQKIEKRFSSDTFRFQLFCNENEIGGPAIAIIYIKGNLCARVEMYNNLVAASWTETVTGRYEEKSIEKDVKSMYAGFCYAIAALRNSGECI